MSRIDPLVILQEGSRAAGQSVAVWGAVWDDLAGGDAGMTLRRGASGDAIPGALAGNEGNSTPEQAVSAHTFPVVVAGALHGEWSLQVAHPVESCDPGNVQRMRESAKNSKQESSIESTVEMEAATTHFGEASGVESSTVISPGSRLMQARPPLLVEPGATQRSQPWFRIGAPHDSEFAGLLESRARISLRPTPDDFDSGNPVPGKANSGVSHGGNKASTEISVRSAPQAKSRSTSSSVRDPEPGAAPLPVSSSPNLEIQLPEAARRGSGHAGIATGEEPTELLGGSLAGSPRNPRSGPNGPGMASSPVALVDQIGQDDPVCAGPSTIGTPLFPFQRETGSGGGTETVPHPMASIHPAAKVDNAARQAVSQAVDEAGFHTAGKSDQAATTAASSAARPGLALNSMRNANPRSNDASLSRAATTPFGETIAALPAPTSPHKFGVGRSPIATNDLAGQRQPETAQILWKSPSPSSAAMKFVDVRSSVMDDPLSSLSRSAEQGTGPVTSDPGAPGNRTTSRPTSSGQTHAPGDLPATTVISPIGGDRGEKVVPAENGVAVPATSDNSPRSVAGASTFRAGNAMDSNLDGSGLKGLTGATKRSGPPASVAQPAVKPTELTSSPLASMPGAWNSGAPTSQAPSLREPIILGSVPKDPFQRIDSATTADDSLRPTTANLQGFPQLSVGYRDPLLGYVELRAHGQAGAVHAELGAESSASGEALQGNLASLASWMHERNTPVESLTVWSSESHSNELSSFAGRQHDTSQGRGQAGSGVQSGQEEGGRQPAHSESHPLSPIPQSRLPASTAWPDSQAAISSSAGRKTADTEIDLWPGNGSPGRNSISVMA